MLLLKMLEEDLVKAENEVDKLTKEIHIINNLPSYSHVAYELHNIFHFNDPSFTLNDIVRYIRDKEHKDKGRKMSANSIFNAEHTRRSIELWLSFAKTFCENMNSSDNVMKILELLSEMNSNDIVTE